MSIIFHADIQFAEYSNPQQDRNVIYFTVILLNFIYLWIPTHIFGFRKSVWTYIT